MSWLTTTAATAKRLKKRSVANSASPKPPEELTFFLDRQLGRYKMAGILRAAGLEVEVHDDHLPQNATDPSVQNSRRRSRRKSRALTPVRLALQDFCLPRLCYLVALVVKCATARAFSGGFAVEEEDVRELR
jgi:hypothetical protein